MKSFASDYCCPPHPAIIQAVVDASSHAIDTPYGEDKITQQAIQCLRNHFGRHIDAYFVSNGTAANRLALKSLLTYSYEAVVCSEHAHINNHEGGALESLGHKVIPVKTVDGKIRPEDLESVVAKQRDIHHACPRVLSISNPTELGTVYDRNELQHLSNYAGNHKLMLHIDGARLANAAASWNADYLGKLIPVGTGNELSVTLGATKNGGMLGEAVINFYPSAAAAIIRLQKQHGQLCARNHCIAAQITALYQEDLWKQSASNANRQAARLHEKCQELGLEPAFPVQSNALFMRLPKNLIPKLQAKTPFYVWDEAEGIVRWMCSWDTTEDDVDQFIDLIKQTMNR